MADKTKLSAAEQTEKFWKYHKVIPKGYALMPFDKVKGIKAAKTKDFYTDIGYPDYWDDRAGGTKIPGFYMFLSLTEAAESASPGCTVPSGIKAKELVENLTEHCPKALYAGKSGNVADRITAPKPTAASDHGLGKWLYDNDLGKADIQVLVIILVDEETGELVDNQKLDIIERAWFDHNTENSTHGDRFFVASYSAVGGENGTEMNTVSTVIAKANKSKLDFIQLKVYERVIQLNMEELLERQREALSDYEVEEDTEE